MILIALKILLFEAICIILVCSLSKAGDTIDSHHVPSRQKYPGNTRQWYKRKTDFN